MKRGVDLGVNIPEYFNLTTYTLEDNVSAGRGDKIAAYYKDEKYSFHDLCCLTNKVGNILKQVGLGFQDRVLLVLQDSPEWLAAWFGTMKIGGVAAHAYTYLKPSDYEYLVNYVQPTVVVVDHTTLDLVRNAVRQAPFVKALLVAGADLPRLEDRELALQDLIQTASPVIEAVRTRSSDLAFWNFSGGTTGKPKGVPHTHGHGITGCEAVQHIVKYTPDDVVLRVPKLFFHYSRDPGMNWAMRRGAAVCLVPEQSSAELMFQLIEKYKPTILVNVPTMMRAMVQSPLAKKAEMKFLRLSISSGEPLSAQLYNDFTHTFGVEVLNFLGSAETNVPQLLDTPGKVQPGSSGRILPGVELKLVDGDGKEVPEGETGVLWVHSPASGTYYFNEPEKSRSTFPVPGWVNSNDLFREDENGYYWYMGRADDLIKVSGVYVSPLEVELCLATHSAVAECAVLGVRDADGLTKTKAFIVLKEGIPACDQMARELQAFCRQKMAAFKAPRVIEFMQDNLPKTGQGKINRQQLLVHAERSDYAFASV